MLKFVQLHILGLHLRDSCSLTPEWQKAGLTGWSTEERGLLLLQVWNLWVLPFPESLLSDDFLFLSFLFVFFLVYFLVLGLPVECRCWCCLRHLVLTGWGAAKASSLFLRCLFTGAPCSLGKLCCSSIKTTYGP